MSILDDLKQVFTTDTQQVTEDVAHNHGVADSGPSTSTDVYVAELEADRLEKDHFFKYSPHSPFEDRASFSDLSYYPPDPAFRYELPLQEADDPELLTFQTSTGDEQTYHRLGTVAFEVDGETAQLAIYRSTSHEGLFLPFRDATSGQETYGAGRYLEPHELSDGRLLIDFNLAYNPYCAYSEYYSCPLPPFENHLKVPIRAGEKAYKKPGAAD